MIVGMTGMFGSQVSNTMEPPNKGHFGTRNFVLLYRGVLYLEVNPMRLGHCEIFFIERCLLFKVSSIQRFHCTLSMNLHTHTQCAAMLHVASVHCWRLFGGS